MVSLILDPYFLEISWRMDLMVSLFFPVRYGKVNVRALQNFHTSGKLHRRLVLAILGDKFDSHRRIENFSYAADALEDQNNIVEFLQSIAAEFIDRVQEPPQAAQVQEALHPRVITILQSFEQS